VRAGFWRSKAGAALLVLLFGLTMILAATALRVQRTTSPQRRAVAQIDFRSMKMRVDDVVFRSSDGLELHGWRMPAAPGARPVILCHDLGSTKESVLHLAIALHDAGFDVTAFDFRGHGDSAGGRSTLGLHEKRDVLGAIDWLAGQPGVETRRIGIYGVGMGAYAAVLAAADRPAVRVLVLDGIYPDAGYRLARGVYAGWGFAADRLEFLPLGVFAMITGTWPHSERASDVIARLPGRHLLLLAPASDASLATAMQRMYETIPQDQVDADGNLVLLPATLGEGLTREQLERYQQRVVEFFDVRLAQSGEPG